MLRLRAVDEVLDVGAGAQTQFSILGCHPSKEVIFLVAGAFHVVAYHLGGGKVQYLGRVVSLGDGDRVEAATGPPLSTRTCSSGPSRCGGVVARWCAASRPSTAANSAASVSDHTMLRAAAA